jgi:signal peptidase II
MPRGRGLAHVTFLAAMLVAAAVVVADRVTKWWVMAVIERGETIPVIPGFLSLVHVRNPGAAFGLLADSASPWREISLVTVSMAAVGGFAWMLHRMPRDAAVERAATAGVIGGALGNLYDRVVYGEVVDFVDAYVGSWHWPAFNVADSAISVGIALLILQSFRGERAGAK